MGCQPSKSRKILDDSSEAQAQNPYLVKVNRKKKKVRPSENSHMQSVSDLSCQQNANMQYYYYPMNQPMPCYYFQPPVMRYPIQPEVRAFENNLFQHVTVQNDFTTKQRSTSHSQAYSLEPQTKKIPEDKLELKWTDSFEKEQEIPEEPQIIIIYEQSQVNVRETQTTQT